MLSREEMQQFADDDRQAQQLADFGGKRPKVTPLQAANVTAGGIFILLDLFAAVTLPDRDVAFWPVWIFTAVGAGGIGAIQWWRETEWLKRYDKHLREIRGTGLSENPVTRRRWGP